MVVGDFAEQLDVVVIGSGPGGYVAAIRAAQLGKDVTIIEKDNIGGACLNVGCIPSKSLIEVANTYQNAIKADRFGIENNGDYTVNFQKAQKWKDKDVVSPLRNGIEALLKKHKVKILKGEAFLVDNQTVRVIYDEESGDVQSYSFNQAIIATGSRPIELKDFKFKGRIIDSTGALNLEELPESLAVMGGGYIGVEIATVYAKLGVKVHIFESQPQILNGFDKQMVDIVVKKLKKYGVEVHTSTTIKSADQTEDKVTIAYQSKEESQLDVDYLLVSVGRRPNTDDIGLHLARVDTDEEGRIIVDSQGRTNQEHIYAIGDAIPGPALAHKASYEAKIVAASICGDKSAAIDYLAIPMVCYCDPEIACVGYDPKEARELGFKAKKARFPYAANGRALSMQATKGFVELVFDDETKTLLGAHVVGAHASELIGELTVLIEQGMTVEDVTLTIHGHPTLSEMILDAAELAIGLPIHI